MAEKIGANAVHQISAIKVFTNRADLMSSGLKGATISKGALHIDNVYAFK